MKTLIELKKQCEEAAKKMTEQRIARLELEIVSAIADGRDYLRVEGLSERVLDVLKDAGYSFEKEDYMNDEQILEYIRNNIVDLAFKNNDNCIKFIDLLVEKDMVCAGIKDSYYNKHHITFHHMFSKEPERLCMQSCARTEKPLVYYEDLFVDKYVVELL